MTQTPRSTTQVFGASHNRKQEYDNLLLCLVSLIIAIENVQHQGCPLRPSLLWMDMRSAQCAEQVLATEDPALSVNSAGAGPVSAEWMIPKVKVGSKTTKTNLDKLSTPVKHRLDNDNSCRLAGIPKIFNSDFYLFWLIRR